MRRSPCPKCGTLKRANANLCKKCYFESLPKYFCLDCGKQIEEGKRCRACYLALLKIGRTKGACQVCGKPIRTRMQRGGKRTSLCRACFFQTRQEHRKWRCQDCGAPVKWNVKRCWNCYKAARKKPKPCPPHWFEIDSSTWIGVCRFCSKKKKFPSPAESLRAMEIQARKFALPIQG